MEMYYRKIYFDNMEAFIDRQERLSIKQGTRFPHILSLAKQEIDKARKFAKTTPIPENMYQLVDQSILKIDKFISTCRERIG